MAEAMRGALSLTVSGFGYASHDIGGFEVCHCACTAVQLCSYTYGLVGPSPRGYLPALGRVWAVLLALAAARVVVLSRSLELRGTCGEDDGEICRCEVQIDAIPLQPCGFPPVLRTSTTLTNYVYHAVCSRFMPTQRVTR